jgi:hypothetical protein
MKKFLATIVTTGGGGSRGALACAWRSSSINALALSRDMHGRILRLQYNDPYPIVTHDSVGVYVMR